MGGEIGVESRLGSGSRFWIRTPLTECEAPAAKLPVKASASQENGAVAAGWKVLLVEDNETNLLVAREMLTHFGCVVEEARNGAEGVAAAKAKAFDLIFMDISMPVLDGLAATGRIRGSQDCASRATPIVGLTAHAMPEELRLMREGGMQECLVKPLRSKQLKSLLLRIGSSRGVESNGETKMVDNTSSATGTLDLETLEEMADVLGAEMFAKRFEAFQQELSALNSGLQALLAAGDIEGLGKFAHKLAGGAAIFGAQQLHAALSAIEAAARSGYADRLPALIEAAEAAGESSERELSKWKRSAFG